MPMPFIHAARARLARHLGAPEFLGYFGASLAALAVDFGLMILLVELAGLHYLIAAAIGFLAGMLLIYWLSVKYIFGYRRLRDRRTELTAFLGVGIAGLLLTQLGMSLLVEMVRLPYPIAKIVTVAGVFLFNYGMRRDLLFVRRSRLLRMPATIRKAVYAWQTGARHRRRTGGSDGGV